MSKLSGLSIRKIACHACSRTLETTTPFITKDYIGLTTPPCACGSTLSKAEVAIPRTEAEEESLLSLVSKTLELVEKQ